MRELEGISHFPSKIGSMERMKSVSRSSPGRKRTTIAMVAERSGFSKATVSRALANPGIVSEPTRHRIQQVARELDYRPNPVARALGSDYLNTVSIVIPDICSDFMAELIVSVREELLRQDYNLLVLDNSAFNTRTSDYLQVLRNQICNGIIFCYEDTDIYMRELARKHPVISFEMSSEDPSISYLLTDVQTCMEEIVGFLHRVHGHERIGAALGRREDSYSVAFQEAFDRALEQCGLVPCEEYKYFGSWTTRYGYEAMQHLVGLVCPPTAVVYLMSSMARGGLAALRELEMDVPGDMSVISADGASLTSYYVPSLATVDYGVGEIGKTLAAMILNGIGGRQENQQRRIIRPRGIRTGNSVGPCRTGRVRSAGCGGKDHGR